MKVTKNQVTREASLPHEAFALQTGQNHGLQLFAPSLRALMPPLLQNLLCPCSRTGPPSFCPFSPEAYLLTGKLQLSEPGFEGLRDG